MRRVAILALLALVCLGGVDAWQILLSRNTVIAKNKTLHSVQDVTFECSVTDFGVPRYFAISNANGSTSNLTVICGEPKYAYTMSRVGYIPSDGRMFMREVCVARDVTAAYKPNNTAELLSRIPAVVGAAARRSLLYFPNLSKGFGDVLDDIGDFFKNDLGMNTYNYFLLPVGEWFKGPNDGCGGECDEIWAKMATMTEALRATSLDIRAQQTLLESLRRARENYTLTWMNDTDRISRRQEEINTLVNGRVAAYEKRINETEEARRIQLASIETGLRNLKPDLDKIDQDGQVVKTILRQNVSELLANQELLVHALGEISDNVTAQIKAIVEDYREIASAAIQTARQNNAFVTDSLGTMRRAIEKRDIRRSLKKVLQIAFETIDFEDNIVFLSDTGAAGLSQANMIWRLEVDQIGIYFMYRDEENRVWAARQSYIFLCDTQRMLAATAPWDDTDSVLRLFGPAGCDHTVNESSPSSCLCHAVHSIQRCRAESRVADYQDSVKELLCDVGNSTVEELVTNATIKTATQFLDSIKMRADLHYATSASLPLELGITSVYSYYTGMLARTTPGKEETETLARTGTVDPDAIMHDSSATNYPTTAFALLVYLTRSFNLLWSSIDTLSDMVDGTFPVGVTYRHIPFARKDGRTSECYQAYWMAYSDVLEPVYRLDPTSVTTVLTAYVDGEVFEDTEVLQSNAVSHLLPNRYIMVGTPPANEEAGYVYDIPQVELSLAPTPFSRRGQVTYAMVSDPSLFSATSWSAANFGFPFDAPSGSNVPRYYRRAVNNSVCTDDVDPQNGGWCGTLTHYSVEVTGTPASGTGKATFTPKSAAAGGVYSGVIRIPAGEITVLALSDCPIATVTTEAPSGKMVTFTNPRTDGATISFDADVVGCVYQTLSGITLSSFESYRLWIPACNGPQRLDLFRISNGGGRVACDHNANVTTHKETVRLTQGLADLNSTNFETVVVQSETNIAMARIAMDVNEALSQVMLSVLRTFTNVGVSVNGLVFDPSIRFAQSRNATNAMINAILSQVNEPYRGAYGAYIAESERIAAEAERQRQENLRRQKEEMDQLREVREFYGVQLLSLGQAMQNASATRERIYDLEQTFREGTLSFFTQAAKGMRLLGKRTVCGIACQLGGALTKGIGSLIKVGSGIAELGEEALELGEDGFNKLKDGATALYKAVDNLVQKALDAGGGLLKGISRAIKDVIEIVALIGTIVLGISIVWYIVRMRKHKKKMKKKRMMLKPTKEGYYEVVSTSGDVDTFPRTGSWADGGEPAEDEGGGGSEEEGEEGTAADEDRLLYDLEKRVEAMRKMVEIISLKRDLSKA